MAREINLVPDIKEEMIKALKLRNLIFFICIVVASASAAVTVIFGIIAGGQQAVVNGKKGTVDALSKKINDYSDLGDFLTIKDQLGNIAEINDNKKVLSRTFGILTAILPQDNGDNSADSIRISELTVNLEEDDPTFSFDAQANANTPPFIDYNVLDSFKKSMQYVRYDYGKYIDKYDNEIPSYCIIEKNVATGETFYDTERRSYYAYWLINGTGCDPTIERSSDEEDADSGDSADDTEDGSTNTKGQINDYNTETYEGQTVVKIWRTPQFKEWYKKERKEGEPYMDLDGNISGVAHFNSECINYYGTEKEGDKIDWVSENETCMLVPNGSEGIRITDSSNGRGASSELVLRFSAVITLNPEVFKFTNSHMLPLAPSGRRNVTDSYVQIQNMFTERATDCAEDDAECKTTTGGN